MTPNRNAPCPCGSGEKYKRCCGVADAQTKTAVGASNAQMLFQRAVQMLRAGQVAAAVPLLAEAVGTDPAHFDAHHALGEALLHLGQLPDAAAVLTRAVALRPGSAAAYHVLATAYDRMDQHVEAIEAYQRVAALSPKFTDVHVRLGQLYAMYSRGEEAAAALDRAAGPAPKTTMARLYKSDAELLRGNLAEAEQFARKAVALEPGSAAAHGTLGGLLYSQGRFADAGESFATALRLDPKSAKCWDGLVHCRKFAAGDGEVAERMQDVLRRQDLDIAARMTIHFALGKVLDDMGDYGGAMAQFDAGNRLRAQDVSLNRAGLVALVDRNIRLFTPAFFARHADMARQTDKPLFILGMYRSGTTLTEQILSSHPDVVAGGELTVWAPLDLEPDEQTGALDEARVRPALDKYLSVLDTIGPAARRVTDKLPANFFRLGAIHALLPRARLIHCMRDPIDTCLSIYTTLFSTRLPFAARKDDLVFYYRQYERMMEHWRAVLPADVLRDVQYETLIADREAQTRHLVDFAGLDWNEACLRPEENQRAIGTSSAWQARQPVYGTSMQRWRRYEPWLGELMRLQK